MTTGRKSGWVYFFTRQIADRSRLTPASSVRSSSRISPDPYHTFRGILFQPLLRSCASCTYSTSGNTHACSIANVQNFMKCLMRMHAASNRGVLFYETVLSFRQQRHTYIEAVPLPHSHFTTAPGYFRESILSSESEWSQHRKLIDFSARPGGFRRALVPNIPYFMVSWDHKGLKGYGHVVESDHFEASRVVNKGGEYEEEVLAEERKNFPEYFAAEVIGQMLGLEPRRWRKPDQYAVSLNKQRAKALGEKFQPYNWTVGLGET